MKRDRPSDHNNLFPEEGQISLVSPFSSLDSHFPAKRPRFSSNSVQPDVPPSFHQTFPPVSASPAGSRKRSRSDETLMDEDLTQQSLVSPDNSSSTIPTSTPQLQQVPQTDGLPRKKVSLESNHPHFTTQVVDLSTGRPLEQAPEQELDFAPDASKSLVRHPNRLKVLSLKSPSPSYFPSSMLQFRPSNSWAYDSHFKDNDEPRLIQYYPTEITPYSTVEEPKPSDSKDFAKHEPSSSVVIEELDDDYDEFNDINIPSKTTSSPTTFSSSPHDQDAMDIE
ncbi:hypothetical protein SPOG_04705 [Schizosaccharomyces cryophilus OY26]|uniref:Uncharacterized protein n=1 Tax=Schizosaccharomyces cryophilus (strain OY26 / ATCC MYA-4695 / CBS 11777 / NBRC 106824 / NRRL Y48691) TaxID=653667 RepID=S9XH27_SCHCR|nr:uncharacterized protein SPOG_04705 [Schizosaccharomyces cryophilus OY26]EPY52976.1 hypothetical protein SPOG_04705 [Schizosaccharomyces cryophilus OY26]